MKSSKWIQFLGGLNLIYTLAVIIMTAIAILLLKEIDFIFKPLVIFLSNILIPFVIALILYYLLEPIVSFAERKKLPRVLAIVVLYLILILLIIWGLSAVIPSLVNQVESLMVNIPIYVNRLGEDLAPFFENLGQNELASDLVNQLQDWARNLPEIISNFLQGGGLSGISSVISGVTSAVVTVIFVPVVLFFLLKDSDQFKEGFVSFLPPAWRDDFLLLVHAISNQVGSYAKGEILVATALGLMTYVGFKLIALNYAGILAIMTGVLGVIPYIGATISFIPALIIAALDSWFMVFKLILVWSIVQFIEGNILQPNIMGQQLDIHPLTIIIIIFVAGDLAGIFGMVLGIPVYAVLKIFVSYYFERFKKRYNRFFARNTEGYELNEVDELLTSKKAQNKKQKKQQ